jgi:hypothetical protein
MVSPAVGSPRAMTDTRRLGYLLSHVAIQKRLVLASVPSEQTLNALEKTSYMDLLSPFWSVSDPAARIADFGSLWTPTGRASFAAETLARESCLQPPLLQRPLRTSTAGGWLPVHGNFVHPFADFRLHEALYPLDAVDTTAPNKEHLVGPGACPSSRHGRRLLTTRTVGSMNLEFTSAQLCSAFRTPASGQRCGRRELAAGCAHRASSKGED